MRAFLRRNLPLLIVLGVLCSLVAIASAKQQAALPAGSWGLSFQTEGQPPVGNTSNDRLRQYDAAYLGDTSQKVIYLTFDAGYENGNVEKIVDALDAHGAHGSFFILENIWSKTTFITNSSSIKTKFLFNTSLQMMVYFSTHSHSFCEIGSTRR